MSDRAQFEVQEITLRVLVDRSENEQDLDWWNWTSLTDSIWAVPTGPSRVIQQFATADAFFDALNSNSLTEPGGPWLVPFDEIMSSVRLAGKSARVADEVVDEMIATVTDFAINNLGDD